MAHADVAAEFDIVPKLHLPANRFAQHVFSVDVEEWFQVGAFEKTISRNDWPTITSRVVLQTERILSLLDQKNIKATFFCLGWVAEREPNLITQISKSGHEVACHGMDHKRLYQMDEVTFLQDILKAKALLEDACGKSVNGYRAPSFSMTEQTWSFYGRMIEAGFTYSSSVFPSKTDHYGMPDAPRMPFFPTKDKAIVEIPMTVAKFGNIAAPASGGGYFRLLPSFVSRYLMSRAFTQTGGSMIFYMHPWEIDPDQPRVPDAPLLSKIRHYSRQSVMFDKLEVLLEREQFTRMDTMLKQQFDIEMNEQ